MTESNQSTSTEVTSTETTAVSTADVNTQAIILISGADVTNVKESDVVGTQADNEILEVLSVLHDSDALEVGNSMVQGMARVDSIAREFAGGDDDDVGEYVQFNKKEFSEKQSVLSEFDLDFDNGKFLYKTNTSEDESLTKKGLKYDSVFGSKNIGSQQLDEESRAEASDLFWQSLDDNNFKASTSIISEDDDAWNYIGAPSE